MTAGDGALDFSYADATVPVRDDLQASQRRAFEKLARPGTWWSGAERVAIAAEARHAPRCATCRARRAALSPHTVSGEHESLGRLPAAAVEAIHQITNDPGRLTRAWFEKTLAAGLDDAHYVELVGVVVTLVSIDAFCRALGVAPRPLPEPAAGEPSFRRPQGAQPEGAWVPMITESRATGPEQGLYETARTGNVIRALSLVPDEVRTLLDLSRAHYLHPAEMADFTRGRTLDRAQIELVAGRVSANRECFY